MTFCKEQKRGKMSSMWTDRTEERVLGNVFGHSLVLSRQWHDEQQSVSGLLTHCSLPVDERDEEGKYEEVGCSLILAGVEKQLQNRWVFSQNAAQLVEQQNQLGFNIRRCGGRTGGQQHHERPQDGLVMQQRLVRLPHQHFVHLQLFQLHVVCELSSKAPHEQTLHHILHHHKLQDGAHRAFLTAFLFNQEEQHVLHIILHSTRLVSRNGTETRAAIRTRA